MKKRLVAYFSASGVTRKAAENIAEAGGYDLYEITPKAAYTKADLNWMDKKSRSSVEMNDKSIRPEIAGAELDVASYDESSRFPHLVVCGSDYRQHIPGKI